MTRFNFILTESRSMRIGVEADNYDSATAIAERFYEKNGNAKTIYQEHEVDDLEADPPESAEVDVVLDSNGYITKDYKTTLELKIEEVEAQLHFHNKNLTKKQMSAIQELLDELKKF